MIEEIKSAVERKTKRLEAWRKCQEEQQDHQQKQPTQCEQKAVELSLPETQMKRYLIDTALPIKDSPSRNKQDSCRSQMSCDSSSNNSGGGEC